MNRKPDGNQRSRGDVGIRDGADLPDHERAASILTEAVNAEVGPLDVAVQAFAEGAMEDDYDPKSVKRG